MKRALSKSSTAVKHLFLILYACLTFVPFLWVVLSSFKSNAQIFSAPFALPEMFSFDNFTRAWAEAGIGRYFLNSLVVSIGTVLLELLVVAMLTYSAGRLLHSKALITLFSLGLMIPIHATLIPNFLTTRNAGLINTPLAPILIYTASNIAFGFFLLRNFLATVPYDLDEAAMIDGASHPRIFFTILLPVCKPGLATVATFAFLNSWNEYLYSSVLLTKKELMSLTVGINNLKGQYTTDYGLLCAGLLFAIIPVVVMYIALQEQVVKGMTAGAVKG